MRISIIYPWLEQEADMYKTMTFALMHFTVAFSVAYMLTGSMMIGGVIALVEPAVNTVAFYYHEKLWNVVGTHRGATSHERLAC
jgi:uncharacterized membrane protein